MEAESAVKCVLLGKCRNSILLNFDSISTLTFPPHQYFEGRGMDHNDENIEADVNWEEHQVLGPSSPLLSPIIVCFHGSGESCASWGPLAQSLSQSYRIVLYNRGIKNPKPITAVEEMLKYLRDSQLLPPYVLVAHSYGGNIGREFLNKRLKDVVGMVLVETGQETALNPAMEEQQYQHQILGTKPLSVIRGNSLISKTKQLERQLESCQDDDQRDALKRSPEYLLIKTWDEEDEKLKKRQLKLSMNNRYVHIPDCGHHVVRDRPDVVAEEVRWVMEEAATILNTSEAKQTEKESKFKLLRRLFPR